MRDLPNWLRWVLVVPAAIGGLIAAFILTVVLMIAGFRFSGPIPSADWLPKWLLVVPWIGPALGFVVAGALAAPRHKIAVGMVLVVIYAFFAGDITLAAILQARLAFYGR